MIQHFDNSENILIIDNDYCSNFYISELFKLYNRDLTILFAKDETEALSICKKHCNIKLTIIDIKMPKISYYDTIMSFKQIHPKMSVIIQTSCRDENIEAIKKIGGNDILIKPFLIKEFNNIVRKYI